MTNPSLDLKTLLTNPYQQGSPFISIKPSHRWVIIGFIFIELTIHFFQYLNSDTSAASWASLGELGGSLLLYLPIFFYRPNYGWFHPLIFIPLFSLLRNLPTFIPNLVTLFTLGPSELRYIPGKNIVLSGWSYESLTWLNGYAALMTIISLIAYYLGFFVFPTPKVPKLKFRPIRHLGFKTVVMVLFCFVIFGVFVQLNGGLVEYLVSNWKGGRHAKLAGDYYWVFLLNFGRLACYIWLVIDPDAIRKPVFWGCFTTSLLMIFFFSGSRGSVVYSIIVTIIIWMLRKRQFSYTKVFTVLLISILGIGLLGSFRSVIQAKGQVDLSTLTDFAQGLEASLGSDDSAGELTGGRLGGPLPFLAYVPERENYLRGSTYLALLTLPVPRVLWPEKPGLCGGRAAQTFYSSKAKWAIPCGEIGEAYWNFGVSGVFLVFFIFGYFHKWLVKWFRKNAMEPLAIIFYAGIIFYVRPDTTAIVKCLQFCVPAFLLMVAWGGISLRKRQSRNTF